jgi:hypothetical protein
LQRSLSKNRVCINIGTEDRFFLFVNLPLHAVFKFAEGSTYSASPKSLAIDVCKMFMLKFPLYPVVKLKVSPGEAYLAPTENIIHDGCTVGQKIFDLHFTFLGRFRVPYMPMLHRQLG